MKDENDIAKKIEESLRLPIVALIIQELKSKLSPNLYYHSSEHTLDVFSEAIRYALMDNLSDREIELLAIAAAYHDAGFLNEADENEGLGAEMAAKAMRLDNSYSEKEITLVQSMILDTKVQKISGRLKQIPTSELSKYLLDADMSNFGRNDFFTKGELVFKELGLTSSKNFLAMSLPLIEAHEWYTQPARSLRQKIKEENLNMLRQKIS